MKTVKGERGAIWTSTWFTKLPPGFQRTGISLWKPRGFKGEHWSVGVLAPGRWYNSVHPKQYLDLYRDILDKLNPQEVADEMFGRIGPNPVMCCFEKPVDIQAGTKFCHRHIAAKWLSDTLGIEVQEIEHPALYPFKVFDRLQIPVPVWPRYKPVNILAGG